MWRQLCRLGQLRRWSRNHASELIHAAYFLSSAGRKQYRTKHEIATSPYAVLESTAIPQHAILVGDSEDNDIDYALKDDPWINGRPSLRLYMRTRRSIYRDNQLRSSKVSDSMLIWYATQL
jgi:hypothetical protein